MAEDLAEPTTVAQARGEGAGEQGGGAGGRDPKWWTLAAVCTGVFILLLDITIVNVALPNIQSELDASLSDLQWVIDAYALSLASLLLTAGSLADLYGRRLVFVIGTALFLVGSIACGLSQDVLFLSISRAFQGIGGAAMFATALALIASAFHGRDRGVAFGVFGAVTGIAVAIGPVLGGVLTSGLSWRWIFFVNVPICVLAIAIAQLRVKESHDPRAGRPDWFGFVSFSLALASLVYGLIEAGQRSWGDTRVIVFLAAAAVLLVVFVVSQVRQRDPMFDLSLLRKPTFTGGLVAAFAVSASIFSLLTFLVIYVQNVLDYSAVATGVRFLFLSGASFFAAAAAGRLTEKVPTKWLIAPGFLLLGVGLLLIHGIADDSSWTHLIPGLTVAGVGIGLINPPLASTAVGVVSTDRAGMASGVNSTFRQVGIATGIAALGSIFSHRVVEVAQPELSRAGLPDAAVGPLTGLLSGGQVNAAAEAARSAAGQQGGTDAGQQAYELLTRVGTHSVVDALNHVTLIAAVMSFVAAVLCFFLIRQQDFVVHGGPPAGGGDQSAGAGQDSSDGAAQDSSAGSARDSSAEVAEDRSTATASAGVGRHVDPTAEPDSGPGPDARHHNAGPHGGAHEAGAHAGEPVEGR